MRNRALRLTRCILLAGLVGAVVAAPGEAKESGGKVKLKLDLPKPVFLGTPKHAPPGTTVDMDKPGKRPAIIVPKGTVNLSLEKEVSSSDEAPIIGELDLVTDGDKEATDGSYVELGPGLQHVQVDLGKTREIEVIVFWNYHGDPRVYHDVVVQISDDADFITGVKTLFSNDRDNSSGLGVGKDREYFETYQGKLIKGKGKKARYVRIYVQGSTADEMNRFTEVEVYGR